MENIFVGHISDENIKYTKNSQKAIKKKKTQLEMGKGHEETSHQRSQISTWKDIQHHWPSEECELKPLHIYQNV